MSSSLISATMVIGTVKLIRADLMLTVRVLLVAGVCVPYQHHLTPSMHMVTQ